MKLLRISLGILSIPGLLVSCSSAVPKKDRPHPSVCVVDAPRREAICQLGRVPLSHFDKYILMSDSDWINIIEYMEVMGDIESLNNEGCLCDDLGALKN